MRTAEQFGTNIVIRFKWSKGDAKAEYHFKYFGLEEIECEGFTNLERDEPTSETNTGGTSVFDELQKENP